MVFSLFVLSLILVCAYFAKVNGGRPHRVKQAFGIVLASSLALFALLNGWDDLTKSDIFDIPVLESLLLGINIFGLFVLRNGAKTLHFQVKRYLLVSSSFLALAYGGWMWSEVIYDRQIISSFDVLQHNPAAPMEQSKPMSQATEKMTDFYVSEDAKLEQPSPRPNASFRLPSAYAMTAR